ncbi:MAG: DUF4065 domain-containing protein [Deltaproteobacteria bacterium]|nr:DUF4065 domain-containing protein [Deltaproteobacteria bacterium]
MVTALDVAAFILKTCGKMTAMKLQKLVYYSQAWHLVWEEKPLFKDPIEAWANGPVVPKLYNAHRGEFEVSEIPGGDAARLSAKQQASVEAVCKYYGKWTSQQLSDLTHQEAPWRDARTGIPDGERGHGEVSPAALAEYYGGLSRKAQ